jgi:hypothetical protein
MKMAPPAFWLKFLSHLAGVDKRLAGELWNAMYPTELHTVGYQISRILDTGAHPACTERYAQVVTPQFMMELCLRLAPEDGKPRRKDVRKLESAILEKSRNGEWS